MRRFLLIFAILFLTPIIGHAATCTSTETVTKCAKISTFYEKIDYEVLSDTEYIIYFRSNGYGYRVPVHGIATESACKLTTAPFERSTIMPPVVPGDTAAKSCAEGSFFAIYNMTASETDICPDGFFTMPYDVSCGAGMVDTANVPNCSDDTSGESCLIPATSAPAPEYKFSISAYDTSSFSFKISAAGTFYVDWGDGNTETIEKPDTTDTTYSHNYSTADTYTIKIGGLATAYNSSRTVASISFEDNMDIESIDGSLGAIFPTLSDGGQPSFYNTFFACYNLADIPETLFSGVTGNAPYMFSYTFAACEGLTSIPENLFSGITGAAEDMFASTFMSCAGITNIPEKLFAGVTGNAPDLFNSTFDACFSLTSIPENLFSGITGAADGMFEYTFQACNMLTGPSARINGKYLYELWPDNVADWGRGMYYDATGLDDYACIPTVMGGGGEECEPAPEVLCTIGISQIKISTGVSFALYAEKYTQPSLAIKYNDGICYGKLEQGNQSGTMNFNYNGTVYHLAN